MDEGLIPQALMPDIEAPPEHHRLVSAGALQGYNLDLENVFSAQNLKFYVDESGGRYASEPLLRRCGAGCACLPTGSHPRADHPLDFFGGFAVTLPGDIQTPARACL